ncbi:MAG: hypothetical protein R3A44_44595 [Caldilineaceae bacterium]
MQAAATLWEGELPQSRPEIQQALMKCASSRAATVMPIWCWNCCSIALSQPQAGISGCAAGLARLAPSITVIMIWPWNSWGKPRSLQQQPAFYQEQPEPPPHPTGATRIRGGAAPSPESDGVVVGDYGASGEVVSAGGIM